MLKFNQTEAFKFVWNVLNIPKFYRVSFFISLKIYKTSLWIIPVYLSIYLPIYLFIIYTLLSSFYKSHIFIYPGNHYLNKDNPEQPDIPELPTETFVVNRYGYYRFRVINTGMLFAFRISVDKVALLSLFSFYLEFFKQ